jgi:environmental stress-induced protein Ves
MRIIRQSDFTATPWKNGGGITHEAIRTPASGDPFRWRVSVARIERGGPFSDFAEYNRTMVLLRGAGVTLKFESGDESTLSHVGDAVQFDGGLAPQCELKNGPCVDLNLIAAKSLQEVHASVRRLDEPLSLPAARGRTMLIFPIDAAVVLRAGTGSDATLEPWDLALISHSDNIASVAPCEPVGAALIFLGALPD